MSLLLRLEERYAQKLTEGKRIAAEYHRRFCSFAVGETETPSAVNPPSNILKLTTVKASRCSHKAQDTAAQGKE